LTLIKPFRALRPAPGRAAEVLAPPYDVLTSAEARERAKGKPWSFLHISKPEIDLDPATDPYDKTVYAKAAENLQRMVSNGILVRDAEPCYYVYRLTWRGHSQTGLAAVASLADYAINRVRKHELTTPVKEDDRVRQIEAINAQTGPVMSGYPNAPEIDAILAQAATAKPDVDVTVDDGVRHQLWRVADTATIEKLTRAFEALPAGGRIMLHEMLLDDDGSGTPTAASFSMLMLLATQGQQFTSGELKGILESAGFEGIGATDTFGYYSIVTGFKP